MKNITVQNLTRSAAVAAIYVILTLAVAPFSYGPIQFRLAEILNLLAFFNPIYIFAVTLGCFISNLFSPFGLYDVFFGTLHTFLSLLLIWKSRHLATASLWPAVLSFLIAWELKLIIGSPFWETWLYVAISEILICSVIALTVFMMLRRSGFLEKYIQAPSFDKLPSDRSKGTWKTPYH